MKIKLIIKIIIIIMYFNKLLLVVFLSNLIINKHMSFRTGKKNNLHSIFGKRIDVLRRIRVLTKLSKAKKAVSKKAPASAIKYY